MMIDKNNIDQVFFNYFEGNLPLPEKEAVDQFVSKNPSVQKDFSAWKNSYVEDEKLQFKNVDSLLANEESGPASWLKWGTSSMILILLSFLSYAVYVKMTPATTESENEKSIVNKGNSVSDDIAAEAIKEEKTAEQIIATSNETVSVIKTIAIAKEGNKTVHTAPVNQTIINSPSDATAVNQRELKFNTLSLADKNLSDYDEAQVSLTMESLERDEMDKKGGLELINLGDPFILYGGVSPIQENPSFAGNTDGIRIKYLARSEWPELKSSSFLTNTISFDGYVNKVKGGVAVLYTSDIMTNNKINTNSFSFVYSPKIKVGKWSIEPSARYTFSSRTINWNQLSAGDSFDPRTGTLFASTAFIPENTAASTIMMNTFGAGILFNGKTIYGGFALDNLFNPSYVDDNFDQKVYIPMKLTAQLGTDIRKNSKSNWVYSPSISYRKQGLYNKLWMSNIVRYKNVIAGASFSTADAMLFSLGYNNNNLRLTYSYSLSGLPFNYSTSNELFASHQITFRYVIKQQTK